MGKKRVVKKGSDTGGDTNAGRLVEKAPKKKMDKGMLYVLAGFNNTIVTLTDERGNMLTQSSSGALGFKGAKKGTPFAAAKVGELIGDKAVQVGIREVAAIIKGAGAGRESAIRAFATKGVGIASIQDRTPVPHNGPRAKKPRRV